VRVLCFRNETFATRLLLFPSLLCSFFLRSRKLAEDSLRGSDKRTPRMFPLSISLFNPLFPKAEGGRLSHAGKSSDQDVCFRLSNLLLLWFLDGGLSRASAVFLRNW